MTNIYKKSMRDALQEARDYRESTDVSEGNLSYDEWLKQVKGIEKGAHGINSDEHAKYSKEWKAYANTSESKLTEIVGGQSKTTVTKDGVIITIKTNDWPTYKAKGWVKRTNESLDLSATGDTTTSNASQEDIVEVKMSFAVVDTADGNKVVALSSDESDAKDSIHMANLPPMSIKNKSTLKIVKTNKKQDIGYSLKEEVAESFLDKDGVDSMGNRVIYDKDGYRILQKTKDGLGDMFVVVSKYKQLLIGWSAKPGGNKATAMKLTSKDKFKWKWGEHSSKYGGQAQGMLPVQTPEQLVAWLKKKGIKEDCGCGHDSDCDCPSDCDCGCNIVNTEEVKLTEGRVMIAVDKKSKKKWQFSGGMKVKHDGKTYDTEGVSMQQVLELSSRQGDIKLGKKDIENGFASGTFSVVNDGSVYQPWKNDFEPEGEQELNEFWPFGKKTKLPKGYNPKPAVKAYDLFHKAYDELKKSGVIDRSGQERLQELYYHLVVNHLGSREANRLKIKTINGPDRRYGDGKIFQDATR